MVREIEHLLEVKTAADFQPGVILTVETVTDMDGAAGRNGRNRN
jgi:hypothetical protein